MQIVYNVKTNKDIKRCNILPLLPWKIYNQNDALV